MRQEEDMRQNMRQSGSSTAQEGGDEEHPSLRHKCLNECVTNASMNASRIDEAMVNDF